MTTTQLPVLVDGEKNPELIPTDLAYRHFILSIAERANLTPSDSARRKALLRPIPLSEADKLALVGALANLREELEVVNNQRALAGTANLAAFLTTEKTLLDAARVTVKSKLSPEGQAALDAFVSNNVKKGIRIYGSN